MNPELPDPIFLPPLHFSNERAYDRRKASLPSLHGDFAHFSRRKLSLPWTTEETVLQTHENSSSISSGIRISARNLTPLPSSSSDNFDDSTSKSEYALPGQPCEEASSRTKSASSRSRSATLPSTRLSLKPEVKDEKNEHLKWQELVANFKTENPKDFRRMSLPVTEQPKLSANQMLPFTTDSFPMNLVSKLPSLLSGKIDPRTTFPKPNIDSIAPKDINVNMRHASVDTSTDHQSSSRTTLLPNSENNVEKHEVTCPHCGETFQPPPSESKSGSCTGTLSTICTYAAMAGVLLVGTGICLCLPFCVKTCKDIHTMCPWWPDLLKELVQQYSTKPITDSESHPHQSDCYSTSSLPNHFNPLENLP